MELHQALGCPHEFNTVTGHPSGAWISASLPDPRARGEGGPAALCLAAWQIAGWHMMKVLWEWLRGWSGLGEVEGGKQLAQCRWLW